MLPALIVPSVRPLGSTIGNLSVGSVMQFTFRQNLIGGGFTDYTSGPVWSTSNQSAALVSASGLVTGMATGSAVISATLAGVTANFTLAVTTNATQDGSFADMQSVITDQHMPSAWEFPSSIVAVDGGGFVSSVPDIRGGTSRLPLTGFAISGNKPSYNAGLGRITTNGNLNYLQTAFDVGYDLNGTKTLVLISTSNPGTADFTGCIQGNGDSAPVLGLAQDATGSGRLGTGGNGAIVPVGKGFASQPGVIGLHVMSQALRLGVGTTLSYPLIAYERPGHVRLVSNLNAVAPVSGSCAVTLGGWRNSLGLVGDAATFCAAYVLDILPTLAVMQALQRRAVVLGATLV